MIALRCTTMICNFSSSGRPLSIDPNEIIAILPASADRQKSCVVLRNEMEIIIDENSRVASGHWYDTLVLNFYMGVEDDDEEEEEVDEDT